MPCSRSTASPARSTRSTRPTTCKRVQAFYQHCRDNDLAISVAQTDVKGDRSAGPAEPAPPGLLHAHRRAPGRWHRRPRREDPHQLHDERQRTHRPPDARHVRSGQGLRAWRSPSR